MSRGGLNFIRRQSERLTKTISGNPMFVLSVLVLSVLYTVETYGNDIWMGYMLVCIASAVVALIMSIVGRKISSTSFRKLSEYLGTPLFALGYYIFLRVYENFRGIELENSEFFMMYYLLFVLLIFTIYMCLQSIVLSRPYESVFMSVLKALMFTLFFSGIMWGGISLILLAINFLLVKIDSKVYRYIAVWVFAFIAPIFFASNQFSPRKEEGADQANEDKKATVPSFFRIVLLYVMVPLTAIYGLVLILYLIRSPFQVLSRANFHGIVFAFSAAVLFVYFSIQSIDSKLSRIFSLASPKLAGIFSVYHLILIIRDIRGYGIRYSDYLLIIFCVYVILFAFITSFVKKDKLVIAPMVMAIILLISILPLVGLYPVVMRSQSRLLIDVLDRNNMWEDQRMVPGSPSTEEDRYLISSTLSTLSTEGELQKIINDDFNVYDITVFRQKTGFDSVFWYDPNNRGRDPDSGNAQYYYWNAPESTVWQVDGAQYIIPWVYFDIYANEKFIESGDGQRYKLTDQSGESYFVDIDYFENDARLRLTDDDGQELILISINEFLDMNISDPTNLSLLSPDQLRLTSVFDSGKITIVFQSLSTAVTEKSTTYSAEGYILVYFE
ncbi:MAG: DUF4153 domain-containing protein [Clostridiaceae bacterium]|nr:DUF4153 domain-containing protein [Clostridiaceae bacterium]